MIRTRLEGSAMRNAFVGALLTCFAFSISALAEPAVRTVANPKGNGDPDAITCRTPRDIAGPSLHIHHYGPAVCATNKVWADLVKNRKEVDANGDVVSVLPMIPSASVMAGDAYYVGNQ